jgi:hypothetical protein
MRAHRHEDGVEAALTALGGEVLNPVSAGDPHTEGLDPLQLGAEHLTGQPVGRNAVAHHPARLVAGVADLDLVAAPGQVVSGRQPARPGTDDQHPLAATGRRRRRRPPPLHSEVAEEALDRVDRDRAVEFGAIAPALAGVITDPTVDRRKRIVGDERTPRLLMVAGLDMSQPGLDVLTGRTGGVARREKVDVDGTATPNGSGPGAPVRQIRQRRDISRDHAVGPRP